MGSEHKNIYTNLFSRLGNKPDSVSDNDFNNILNLKDSWLNFIYCLRKILLVTR